MLSLSLPTHSGVSFVLVTALRSLELLPDFMTGSSFPPTCVLAFGGDAHFFLSSW